MSSVADTCIQQVMLELPSGLWRLQTVSHPMMDVCRGQTVEVGFFSCKEAFRCLNTSSLSFASMTSLGTGCLELECSFLWSLPLLVD